MRLSANLAVNTGDDVGHRRESLGIGLDTGRISRPEFGQVVQIMAIAQSRASSPDPRERHLCKISNLT